MNVMRGTPAAQYGDDMSTFKTYCGATCLTTTHDALAAIARAYECVSTSPASAVTIERDGEELSVADIQDLEHRLTLGMSFEELQAHGLAAI